MAIFEKSELAELKAKWKAALIAAASGNEYTIGSQSLTRQDLPQIQSMLEWLDQQETELNGRRGSLKSVLRVKR